MAGQGIKAGGLYVDFGMTLKGFDDGLKKLSSNLAKIERSFSNLGQGLTKTLTLPLASVGAAALKAANDYDQAFATIRRGTGATGDNLKDLEESFKSVFRGGDDTAAEVSKALADLNTRTGLTGKSLEGLTTTILDLGDVTGADLNVLVASSTRLFGDWSVSVDKQTSALDFLYKVSQTTGIEIGRLNELLVQFGAPLRQLGFSLEQSAALLGKFEKEGVNTELVMGGLRVAIGRLAKEGIPLQQGLEGIFERIKGAKSSSEATALAIKAFNQKVGADMAAAIREGRFELDALLTQLQSSPETIAKAAADSETFAQKIQKATNQLTAALEPIGRVLLDSLSEGLAGLSGTLDQLGKSIAAIPKEQLTSIVTALAGLAVVGPVLAGIGLVVGGLRQLTVGLRGALALIGVAGPWGVGLTVAAGIAVALSTDVSNLAKDIAKLGGASEDTAGLVEVSFKGMGKAIREFFTNPLATANDVLKTTGILLKGAVTGKLLSDSGAAEIAKEIKGIESIQRETLKVNVRADIAAYRQFKATAEDTFAGIATAYGEAADVFGGAAGAGKGGTMAAGVAEINSLFEDTKSKASEAADAVKSLQTQLADKQRANVLADLREGLDAAIKSQDFQAYSQLRKQFEDVTREGVLEGLKDSIEKGGPEAKKHGEAIAEATVLGLEDSLPSYAAELKKVHTEAAQFYRNAFQNAITGTTFDIKDFLEQAAVGFAADIAASLTKNVAGLKDLLKGSASPQDFGANIAQTIFGSNNLGETKVSDISLDQITTAIFGESAAREDFIGPFTELGNVTDGLTDKLFAGANSLGAWTSAVLGSIDSFSKIGKSSEGTATGLGQIGGSALGAYFGGPVGAQIGGAIGEMAGKGISKIFGFGGSQNPDTIARREVVGKLEELINAVGGLKFFDEGGKLNNVSDIRLGTDSRFNEEGWAEGLLSEFGATSTNMFLGVGEALKDLLGVTQEIGGQIGAILLEQFRGDTEAIKALIDVAGLSYEQFVDFLVDEGKRGEQTWLAIVSQVRDAQEAFASGLTGNGQFVQAFQNLLNTAGKGQIALNQVQNIAIEAKEAGFEAIDSIRDGLVASGLFTAEQIEGLFAAFAQLNLTNLDEIVGATDLQLGQIVAGLDAYLQDHKATWGSAAEDVKQYEENLNKLDNKEVQIKLRVTTAFDNNTQNLIDEDLVDGSDLSLTGDFDVTKRLASGAILRGPTMIRPGMLAGEAGAEAVLPLANVSGKLGVRANFSGKANSGSVTIYVDARNAQRGVEADIQRSLVELEERIVSRTINVIYDAAARGGF